MGEIQNDQGAKVVPWIGKALNRIENRKLGWVLGASMDMRAWVMSNPAPS